MLYIWTLDAHELHGPYLGAAAAHRYAKAVGLSTYELLPHDKVTQFMWEQLRKDYTMVLELRCNSKLEYVVTLWNQPAPIGQIDIPVSSKIAGVALMRQMFKENPYLLPTDDQASAFEQVA